MRCKTCGWLLSDIDGHLDAMYEDHIADHPAEAWRDRQGDVWVLGDDGLLHARETAPFTREHVEKKWGPLVPVFAEVRSTTGPASCNPDCRHRCPECRMGLGSHLTCDVRCEVRITDDQAP